MWAAMIVMFAGVWMMAAPAVLGYDGGFAADHARVVGPLLATFGCVAMWEVTRPLRWVNLATGAWLLVAPWIFGFPTPATLNCLIAGAAVILLSLVRGRLTHSFAGGWRSLLPSRPLADG